MIDASSSDEEILDVLHRTADAVAGVLQANTDWSLSGKRATQYSVDLAADAAALAVLHGAGCAVLSEESQITGEWKTGGLMVVMDPLDGSTNASKRVPWYATALCAIDADGMRASLVVNQASGRDRYWATRGGGAFHNGIRLQVAERNTLRDSVIGFLACRVFGLRGVSSVRSARRHSTSASSPPARSMAGSTSTATACGTTSRACSCARKLASS